MDYKREHLATGYENIPRIDIVRTGKAVPRMEAEQNSAEQLLFDVVSRVVTWSEFDVRKMSGCARVFDAYRRAD